MKRFILAACCAAFAALASAPAGRAQTGAVAVGPDPTAVTDAESDKAARHELEVARHYFKNKKAYYASFKRCEELAAGYPEFQKIDEVLYMAGMSSLYLSEGKGKQRPPASAPDKAAELSPQGLRETAREYLTRLVKDYPDSKFRKDAEEALAQLGGAAAPAAPGAEKPRPRP
ncbi:MAG TPA: outer membrane protein assembly factor BamD [Pyrinomonadaceae bacterium]|jgi:outer membrane protein assembly factor BamD (BamD/ComL family)